MSRRAGLPRLEPRVVVALLAGGLLLVAAAAWALLLRDPVRSYRQLSEERGASQAEVTREREGLDPARLAAAEAEVRRLEEALYGAGPDVPVSQMASHVIGRLDGLARQHRVRLASVTPGAQAEVLRFTEVPFDVDVEGDYARLIAWLRSAERDLRPMVVKRFRIEPARDESGLLRMALRVVSYRAPRLP